MVGNGAVASDTEEDDVAERRRVLANERANTGRVQIDYGTIDVGDMVAIRPIDRDKRGCESTPTRKDGRMDGRRMRGLVNVSGVQSRRWDRRKSFDVVQPGGGSAPKWRRALAEWYGTVLWC